MTAALSSYLSNSFAQFTQRFDHLTKKEKVLFGGAALLTVSMAPSASAGAVAAGGAIIFYEAIIGEIYEPIRLAAGAAIAAVAGAVATTNESIPILITGLGLGVATNHLKTLWPPSFGAKQQ